MSDDTFLEPAAAGQLAANLATIGEQSAELLRIARHETSPPGGRAARRPTVPGSAPPVHLGALSVSHEIHTCLTGWMRCLADDTGIDYPAGADDRTAARHLAHHAHRIAQQPWALDCADEIEHWATTIRGLTIAPRAPQLDEYTEAQRREGMAIAKVSAAMCADFVCHHLDDDGAVTAEQIRKWGQRGHIDTYGPRNLRTYSVRQVLERIQSRRRKRRVAHELSSRMG